VPNADYRANSLSAPSKSLAAPPLSIRGADEAAPGGLSVGKRFELRVGPLGLSTDARCPLGPA